MSDAALPSGYCAATCGRCGAAFACGAAADRATPCACTQVRLGPDQLTALRARYVGCLCLDCLRTLEAPAEPAR